MTSVLMHPEKAFSFKSCWNQIHLEVAHYSFVCIRFLKNVGGKGEKAEIKSGLRPV